ncbi:MAG: DNA primase, partial [Acidobacteria bacterium]|nr:DNA primase [Acidobacteriota bacterium]
EARLPQERERLLRLHQNAQRLLAPVAVVNLYAPQLRFPDDRLSARRDHRKYLGLIRAIAFARQQQREIKDGAVSVTLEDIALANRLAHHALGQSLYDLTPSSRRLLFEIRDWLREGAKRDGPQPEDLRFSQRELRDQVGWKKTQLCEHVRELVEAEYLVPHVTGPGRRTRYALDWDGQGLDGERFYRGLVDTTTLAGPQPPGSLPGHDRNSPGNGKSRRKRPKDANSPKSASSDRCSGGRRS